MIHPRSPHIIAGAFLALTLASCSSLRLENVDFGWPVESALTVSERNTVEDSRYALSLSVTPLAEAEFQDTAALKGATLRVLRSTEGYYFVTGKGFTHVYVFGPGPSELVRYAAIAVVPEAEGARKGLKSPALNQRTPYVELVDEGTPSRLLSADGIVTNPSEGGDAR